MPSGFKFLTATLLLGFSAFTLTASSQAGLLRGAVDSAKGAVGGALLVRWWSLAGQQLG
jgi:hypothetical protein